VIARGGTTKVAVAVLAVTVALAATAGAAPTPSPARMVLRASDLPPGFIVVRRETGPWTNGDVIRTNGRAAARKIERWGRLTGYKAMLEQRDVRNGALPGVFTFVATVDVFRTASGAHAALSDPASGCRAKAKKMTRVPLAGHRPVGPDTLVCTRRLPVPRVLRVRDVWLRVFMVQWRNGRVLGVVGVTSIEGAVTPLAALTAARRQNRRMSAELRRG
jgi:hypothetical protein